jgi:cytochrome c biogenesis protein
MQTAYSPQMLRILDAVGLTDVYHAWWFAALLALTAISIIFASVERWPNVWRFFARPYRKTDSHFRAVLPLHAQIPVERAADGLSAAQNALKKAGFKPQRIADEKEIHLYAEKHRFSLLAVYVIHASLLLIFLGGIVDAVLGYRGNINLIPGTPAVSSVQLRDDSVRNLPFAIRCDDAGMDRYPDGSPKRYWSNLAVVENGHDVLKKNIEVNEPLIYKGLRFYQADYGQSDRPKAYVIAAGSTTNAEDIKSVTVPVDGTADFQGNKLRVVKFYPDAYRQDNGQVFQRSRSLSTPAAQLEMTTPAGKTYTTWLLYGEPARIGDTNSAMQLSGLALNVYTGLEISYEPGQGFVWAGCLLLGLGLMVAFYLAHMRLWATVVDSPTAGLVLWIGGASNKHRDAFEQRFHDLVNDIETELNVKAVSAPLRAEAATSSK